MHSCSRARDDEQDKHTEKLPLPYVIFSFHTRGLQSGLNFIRSVCKALKV